MTSHDLSTLTLALLLLVLGANLLGLLFVRLHQPKVVGEIAAGIVLGPSLLGHLAPGAAASIFGRSSGDPASVVLEFLYQLGLLLLMFMSGSSIRHVLDDQNRRPTAWILGVGTPLPFVVALAGAPFLHLDALAGTAHNTTAVMLVFAIAVAVTSIPVLSKIFYDLGVLHTRFAGLVLGVAVVEDIVLWAVLAIATAIVSAGASAGNQLHTISTHVGVSVAYVTVAMTVAPRVLGRLGRARWNVLAAQSPVAWIVVILLGYVSAAAAIGVTPVFAAFLAGFGIVGGTKATEHHQFRASLDSLSQLAAAVFVPIYFAIVGYRLDFTKTFSPALAVAFLAGSSALRLLSVGLAARLAGFRGLAIVNLALTMNARGGPGIVLASVAFDAGIINARFFTTLVLTAIITSQMCGFWLDVVLRKGWPLLAGDVETPGEEVPTRRGGPPARYADAAAAGQAP